MRPQNTLFFSIAALIALGCSVQDAEAQLFRSRSNCYCPQAVRVQPTCQDQFRYAPVNTLQSQPLIQNLYVPPQIASTPAVVTNPISIPAPTVIAGPIQMAAPTNEVILSPPMETFTASQPKELSAPATVTPANHEEAVKTIESVEGSPAPAVDNSEAILPVPAGDAEVTEVPAAIDEKSILKK